MSGAGGFASAGTMNEHGRHDGRGGRLSLLTSLLACLVLAAAMPLQVAAYEVSGVSWQQREGGVEVRISGNAEPTFTQYELVEPQRLVIDIAGGALAPDLTWPLSVGQGVVDTINAKVVGSGENSTSRLELLLSASQSYSIKQQGSDILINFMPVVAANAKGQAVEVKITDLQVNAVSASKATITLYGSQPLLSYLTSEEERDETRSARLIIDLPNVQVDDKVIPVVLDSPVALIRAKQGQKGGRIIVDSAYDALFAYDVKVSGNYLELNITAPTGGTGNDGEMIALLTGNGAEGGEDDFAMAAADGGSDAAPQAGSGGDGMGGLSLSGYDEQRISVDFYKIDLHNVFRLIGEISNRNIIVDEAVGGSLTLAMKDVPWDFLLDVVLNLKDLAKEERYNTIVISPKSAEFNWPETAGGVELDVTVEEAITVTKRMQTSNDQVEAKKLLHEASTLDAKGETAKAMAIYEQAFQLWSENGTLAQQIATLALVKLGQNAKAAHYSKLAVQLDPTNTKAALLAAMSMANMENTQEAKEYFDLAVSDAKPSRHALASYAAFSEQNESYESALNLLAQYDQFYGTSLETMISRARIYDAMGDGERADMEYKAIKLSGYELPADLEAYVTGRVN
ncbi:MAG: AMIN domain-containing protein [Thermodesulfobacteriota bacterium]